MGVGATITDVRSAQSDGDGVRCYRTVILTYNRSTGHRTVPNFLCVVLLYVEEEYY